MPVVALGFAVAPVAGQNFGAGLPHRVRETFRRAALLAVAIMGPFTLLCVIAPHPLIRFFSSDEAVVRAGVQYLRIVSWSLVASGVIYVNGSMFQAMGNTIPPLIASFTRSFVALVPAVLLARMAGFELRWIWWLSVGATLLQFLLNLLLLRREFRIRLVSG